MPTLISCKGTFPSQNSSTFAHCASAGGGHERTRSSFRSSAAYRSPPAPSPPQRTSMGMNKGAHTDMQ
eukprot:1686942-Lingulodinium_polyedra.AAC.1